MKSNIIILIILSFFLTGATLIQSTGSAESATINKVPINDAKKTESLPDFGSTSKVMTKVDVIPFRANSITNSPGRIIGTTYYDFQTIGSTGSRIVKDSLNGIHICWMNGIGTWSGNRWVYYNFLDEFRNPAWSGGISVSTIQGAGFCQIDINDDNAAVIAYHNFDLSVKAAVDAGRGFGLFTLYDVPNEYPGGNRFCWPYLTVDRNERIHVVFSENATGGGDFLMGGYTRSDDDSIMIFDTLMDRSAIVVSSNVDDKVAIVYTKPIDDGTEPNYYNNDVVYIESPDGVTWDFTDKINITNYLYDDTIRAYTDLDAVYDFDGDLHIIWTTPGYFADDGTITVDACLLWHWSQATGINLVADGWWPSYPGAWNRSISKMSIGVNVYNNLYALWSQFDDIDVSAGGWSNGDLYYNYSLDQGVTWAEPENITNSYTEDCLPGDCESDHWSTLSEIVDDSLYICYLEDKDAGSIPHQGGSQTENPIRYLGIFAPDEGPRLLLRYNAEDFIFDVTGDSAVSLNFDIVSLRANGYVKQLCDSSWVSFDQDSVNITEGDTVTIAATFDANGLDYNTTYLTDIYFESDSYGLEDDSIRVEMTTVQPIPITIGMIPDESPVIVEPGGFFTYEGVLANNIPGPFSVLTDVWIKVKLPRNYYYGPVCYWYNIPIEPLQTNNYPGIIQHVSPYAIAGDYTYIAYCGPAYSEIMDSTYFNFTIVNGFGGFNRNWDVYGWGDENDGFENLPAQFELFQNYPNPFNACTNISFDIPEAVNISLEVYNLAGQVVETLREGYTPPGHYTVIWDASTYSSGVYFYRLNIGEETYTKRMTLLK